MMPNFLILGAAKAGTTSLYHYLRQHPDIYMSPVKEPKFFALENEPLEFSRPGDREKMQRSSVTDLDSYRALFRGAAAAKAVGEASTLYLYSSVAPSRIKHYVPAAKMLAILRHPVERAYSNFLYMARKGEEPLRDFEQALRQEATRRAWMPTWHYTERGFYHRQLRRYYDLFPRDQIRVYLYEDLSTDPTGLLRDVFRFVGVDESFTPESLSRHNVSGLPRSEALHGLLARPHAVRSVVRRFLPRAMRQRVAAKIRRRNLYRPQLSDRTRERLNTIYRDDILRLQDLIQRDLSRWLA